MSWHRQRKARMSGSLPPPGSRVPHEHSAPTGWNIPLLRVGIFRPYGVGIFRPYGATVWFVWRFEILQTFRPYGALLCGGNPKSQADCERAIQTQLCDFDAFYSVELRRSKSQVTWPDNRWPRVAISAAFFPSAFFSVKESGRREAYP